MSMTLKRSNQKGRSQQPTSQRNSQKESAKKGKERRRDTNLTQEIAKSDDAAGPNNPQTKTHKKQTNK